MDIYSAEGHVQKLLTYVEDLQNSKPKMYATTKCRLRDLASTCQKIVHLISNILEQEILDESSNEFEQCTDINVIKSLDLMEREMVQLRKFVSGNQLTAVYPKSEHSSVSRQKISSSCRKRIISCYGSTLSDLTKSCPYPVVSDCAKLLWNWFDCRFLQTSYPRSNFHYNIHRLPYWLCDIVIAYGKHIENGTQLQFIREFNSWCESLVVSGQSNKYAVPYEIYQIDTNLMPSDMTLAAVVLWDVLFDNGLDHLCIKDSVDVYLSEDMLYKRCSEISSNLLDDYRNYKDDISILYECKLAVNSEHGGEHIQ